MKTQIFKTYEKFIRRKDKSINGVSPEFQVEYNIDLSKDSGNTNCWNCTNCSYCSNCSCCIDCSKCIGCSYCIDCSGCSRCYLCVECSKCVDCVECSSKKTTQE